MKKIADYITLIVVVISVITLSGCGQKKTATSIRVMAASSMTQVFTAAKKQFEEKYPEIEVELNFAGSQKLAQQIRQGIYADVFASANQKYMNILVGQNLAKSPVIIAKNRLTAVINRELTGVGELKDLAKPGVKISIADEAVPAGRYTLAVLGKIRESQDFPADFKEKFLKNIISKELNVKSVVAKIELGEVDAGIVYATDITNENSDKIRPVQIDEKFNVTAEYPVAVLQNSAKKQIAQKFVEFLSGESGQKILKEYGFVLPND